MSDGESDDGRRASKKRKASRACDRCNSQHQPCDNAIPKCGVCVRAGTECTYNRPVRKRGPRSGYTGQNGERLWAIVLQERPEIEDIVLHILRRGTYADTGVSNLEYYRNHDNQTDLVNKFNESRLGRFLQHGERPDLNLPPIDQELPPLITSFQKPRDRTTSRESSNGVTPSNMPPTLVHQRSSVVSSGASAASPPLVHPHGAPQNPGDIYLQSEDIRRRVFESPQDKRFEFSGNSIRREPTLPGINVEPNGSIENYSDQPSYTPSLRPIGNMNHLPPPPDLPQPIPPTILQPSFQPKPINALEPEQPEFDVAYTSQWLDTIPADTLLNLGFAPGEGMEQDFFELCANPDPIDSTLAGHVFADQDEDEEAVWRRLVMRGRFI
ncbi:hypothetical protein F5Y16DRAFT_176778 [Xylariaceae sp. FL0255]|nr:hypothetical protein F5Y16DRAFT_176778 [Xylariaceae sp. FL0255]